jgi:hypothetical protein
MGPFPIDVKLAKELFQKPTWNILTFVFEDKSQKCRIEVHHMVRDLTHWVI